MSVAASRCLKDLKALAFENEGNDRHHGSVRMQYFEHCWAFIELILFNVKHGNPRTLYWLKNNLVIPTGRTWR